MKIIFSLIIGLISIGDLASQNSRFEVVLTPYNIENLGGIQSYSVGTHEGEWLIVGGRLDGLHQRQPFASFSSDGNNLDIIVVNPVSKKVWKKPLASLPTPIREQLSSTNMQFFQEGDRLIVTGGYGFSPSIDDHITYPYLTAIDLPSVIEDIKNGELSSDDFLQIEDESFQVAGGRLAKIGDAFFLVGGHRFMGRYNPMGPDHGPGFEQKYSNEIRRFTLDFDNGIQLDMRSPIHDEMHLRRRDYNLGPTMLNGEEGLMIYSGVFQNNADLPWLYPVQISDNNYVPREDFNQYFNHYHCATLPIYLESEDEMHTLFFGGIAQFYMDGNLLVQDNDVPFVNTISDVIQSESGVLSETVLNEKMPGYIGAGSEFIYSSDLELYENGVLKEEAIGDDYVDVGYIYGGIRSSLPNIFWINDGTQSEASSTIYKVSVRNRKSTATNSPTASKEKLFFYPNPTQKFVKMSIDIDEVSDILVEIKDMNGMRIHSQNILKDKVKIGHNMIVLDDVNIGFGAFLYTVKFGNKAITRKVIWSE